jgi:hypothetical protein
MASLAVMVLGQAFSREGAMLVFVFWVLLGIAQWVYVLPAALLARAMGWRGMARGLWLGGALGVLLSAGCWALNVAGPLRERIVGNTPPGTVYAGNDALVVEADAGHVTVRFPQGQLESYALTPETGFGYLGPAYRQQAAPAGPARLRPGARVSVSWVLRGGRKHAARVTLWADTPDPVAPPDAPD